MQFVEKIGMTPFVLVQSCSWSGAFAYMMPPLVYASGIQQSLAEELAKTLGTICKLKARIQSSTPSLFIRSWTIIFSSRGKIN